MTNGPLTGKLLLFSLPLMLSSILQLLFNTADMVVVGRFAGSEALAAVGSTGSLVNLMINWFLGFSVGTNVVVAQELGAGRREEANRSVHTAISFSIVSSMVLATVAFILCRRILVLMKSPTDVVDLSVLYLRIYFCGIPASMLYNFGASILRSQGDTRRPLYFLTASGVINVCLNLLFVVVFRMSVAGVALATIISQYISAGLVLITLMREKGPLRLELKKLELNLGIVARITRVGLPAGIQSMVFSISNVALQSAVNSFGSTAIVAGSAAANNIEGFLYVIANSFTQAALTFTSQNYSAGKTKRVDRIMGLCLFYGPSLSFMACMLAYRFAEPLATLYIPDDTAAVAAAVTRMGIIAATYFLDGLMDIQVGVLRGVGFSVAPMLISMLGACGSRLLWIATVFRVYHTPEILYLCYPVSWILTFAAELIFFFIVRKRVYAKVSVLHTQD